MIEQDGLSLNIYSSSQSDKERRPTVSKVERLKRFREKKNAPADGEREVVSQTKVKRIRGEAGGDGNKSSSKFSSLFKNNPEIPHIPSVTVERPKEDVFSGDRFSELDLHPHMVANLEQRLNITQLTAVQKASIPHVLTGKDVMIKSQTGSGKTLCYAVPVVQNLQSIHPHIERTDGPYALVLVPTRELALQSLDTIQTLVQPFQWIVPGCIMGGERKKAEKARLRKGINILIGTPGRLHDHLQNTKSLQMQHLRYVIIDEADRLLDMGFEQEVKQILSCLEEKSVAKRQTLLLSATLSQRVEKLAGMSLSDPIRIQITETDSSEEVSSFGTETFATPDSLKHHLVVVPNKLRLVTLAAFILWKTKYTNKNKKMVVFLATQHSVEFHHRLIELALCSEDEELKLYKLHGEMLQKERTKVFKEFCNVETGVLFCTDVAARGLDLPHVRWIIQYNTPGSATDYIHRVGRTARIGSQGHALLFLTPAEIEYAKVLQACKINLVELQMDDILKTLLIEAHNKPRTFTNKTIHTIQEGATELQHRIEEMIENDKSLRTGARKAYQSFVRSYATYPSNLKHIFHVKNLHLGHLAKSFGLKDTPTHIADVVTKTMSAGGFKRKFDQMDTYSTQSKKPRIHMMSEFSSGLDTIKKGKTKLTQKPNNTAQRNQYERRQKFIPKGNVTKFSKKSFQNKKKQR